MALKFDEFLKECAEDSVNGGSGDWPKPTKGEFAAYAGGLKLDVQTVNEGRGSSAMPDPSKGLCIHCGERARLDDDGWCARCDGDDPAYKAELAKRACAEAWSGADKKAAAYLRRLSQAKGLTARERTVLLEEAELLERRAS